ncbi:hypothetical protein HBI95_014600 [Parastagonospora nodorum]|nr:hypothetical protein HBI95_014600 [Parastagonospora nodorum]KAH5203106.1 hypothetical protein HBH68_110270 [Parastagonospora nodorum]KAH5273165.1 hypothetical protein HBI72_056900 [Parastagonospora nodorum]KAH5414537.1 hypothetical protein HBI47_151040 [Parastagonospora nodorum]KAH5608797.1 hypothetical protein HBI45_078080 [Parastagonospora nodorum]
MWETPSPNAEKTSPPAPNGDDTWMDLGGEELEQQEDEPTIQHCNAVLKISPPLPYGSGAPAAAKGDDAPIDLGGDELEQQEEDQIVQPPPKAASTSSKGKEKAVENTAHGSLALGEAGRTAIQDALEGAADDDEFASNVLSLLKAVIEAEKAAGMGPGEAGITIGRQKLYRDDVLSLYCLDGQEGAAWFREGIINALLTLEESHGPASVHIESDFALWFEDRYTAVLDRDIEKAEGDGSAPETGWPFIDLRDHHSRILASLNPSGVHWVAVEISIPLEEDAPMKLIYYNSMSRMTVEDPTFVAATQTLPKLLYLASLRPGSPLAGFNPHTLIVEEAQCPQQVGSWDCGPFSVYFLAKRLHNERIRRTSTNYFHQRDMGRRLRRACAKVLHMNHARDARTSLKEAFAETEPEPLEDEGDTDADLDAQIAALAAAAAADANSTTSGEADGQEGSLLIGTDLRPVIRFEIGAASRSVRTIILIIRWSSQPWFWRTYCLHVQAAGGTVDLGRFRTVVESLARERLAIYLEACGDVTAIEDLHIIVYAGTGIHTRFVPCSVDEAVEEAAEKAAEKAAKKATEKAAKKAAEANGFLQCPIKPCDKRWSKVKGKTLTRLLRHLWNHMPHPIQSVDSEGKITYRCPIGSCKFENSSKKPKDSVSAHISKTHAQVWLEEQMAKGLCIVPPELKELLEDGSESQCPYCGHSFTGTSAEDNLNYHMKRLHFREDNLPGWFTCEHVDEIDLGRSWDELQPGLQARLISSWGSDTGSLLGHLISMKKWGFAAHVSNLQRLYKHTKLEFTDELECTTELELTNDLEFTNQLEFTNVPLFQEHSEDHMET